MSTFSPFFSNLSAAIEPPGPLPTTSVSYTISGKISTLSSSVLAYSTLNSDSNTRIVFPAINLNKIFFG